MTLLLFSRENNMYFNERQLAQLGARQGRS